MVLLRAESERTENKRRCRVETIGSGAAFFSFSGRCVCLMPKSNSGAARHAGSAYELMKGRWAPDGRAR
jgi:hypothetical protein